MNFWWGLIVGLIAGANIGVVVSGLMAGARREERSQEHLLGELPMDQAVMDEAPAETPRALCPLEDASADPVI
jgi:uncharacterized membrane-anchored protein YhcB (DUF1043 family)